MWSFSSAHSEPRPGGSATTTWHSCHLVTLPSRRGSVFRAFPHCSPYLCRAPSSLPVAASISKPSTLEVQVSTDVAGPASLVEQLYSELEQKVRGLRPKDDFSQLEKAYRVASEAHKD